VVLSVSAREGGLTPEQRSLRAKGAAYALHAKGGTNTRAATAAQLSRYERQVLEDAAARGEVITPDELARRSRYALKSAMTLLALKASRSRHPRTAGQKRAGAVMSAAPLRDQPTTDCDAKLEVLTPHPIFSGRPR
jgi:hypothetical protein